MRMAMVGAGAIAELGHLPALSLTDAVVLTAVVDTDLGRARRVAEAFGAPLALDTTQGLGAHADFACVAVPHHVHEAVSLALLQEGLHLLIEKPLAISVRGCDEIIAAARAADKRLGVAMPRRYGPAARFAKAALDAGLLGQLLSFSIESGTSEVWPARSGYMLDPQKSGGGVLMGNGCHDLDFARWLFGPYAITGCAMDSLQRSETDCKVTLRLASGSSGTIELSRTRDLRNGMKVEGEKGRLAMDLIGETVSLMVGGQELAGTAWKAGPKAGAPFSFARIMAEQIEDFAAAIRGQRNLEVDGVAGREVVALMEACYAMARPLEQPWRRTIDLTFVAGTARVA
jgi:predicted dehydrogenase